METLREIYETDTMTEELAEMFCNLLGKRCKPENKRLLKGRIKYGSHHRNEWYAERLYIENGTVHYMAGQDYISEIAFIRKEFLK